MPIYEYRCKACGQHHEELQGINDKPLTKCPACHKSKLEKLVSSPAFQLKGTGWYVTDFKNPQKKPEAASEKKETATSTSSNNTDSAKSTPTAETKPKKSSKKDAE